MSDVRENIDNSYYSPNEEGSSLWIIVMVLAERSPSGAAALFVICS